jgi:DNA-binding NtrC family response regulator
LGVGEVPDRDKKLCQTRLKATLEVIMLSRTLIFHREAKSAQTNGQILDASGYQCEIATTLAEARTLLGSQRYQLLLLERDDASANTQPDNYRGGNRGVVAVTAYETLSAAATALSSTALPVSGAKTTFDSQLLLRVLGFAAEASPAKQSLPGMVGESHALKEAIARAYRAARSDASILLYGESGTGKELAARAIHGGSSRAANPFVAVDCASLPENLLEAELFGYDKGAFTGAFKAKPGLMELAHHGTLFLDEIGEIPISLQAKLLRALQEKEHRRLGGTQSIVFDARVIAATNRDLRQRVAEGSFREDLFFRLNVIPIRLPALRERTEDIGPIAAHVVAKHCESDTGMLKTLDKEVLEAFQKYPWPGNVRELENVVRQMCIMADGPIVNVRDLPDEILEKAYDGSQPATDGNDRVWDLAFIEARKRNVNWFEAAYMRNLLERCGGNISRASEVADIDRKTFYRLLRKHNLQRPNHWKTEHSVQAGSRVS